MQIWVSQGILYRDLVVFIPPRKYLLDVSINFRARNIAFAKGRYGNFDITIKAVQFNLDLCIWIIIHRQIHWETFEEYCRSDAKYWIHCNTRQNYNYTRKALGNH